MATDSGAAKTVVELPSVSGKSALLRTLDLFTMDVLSTIIGFEEGSLELARAGYRYVGHIAASQPEALLAVKGMTPWKLKRIEGYLRRIGLTFGMDTSEWLAVRERIDAAPPSLIPAFARSKLRLVRS
jgi:hypothetical protein